MRAFYPFICLPNKPDFVPFSRVCHLSYAAYPQRLLKIQNQSGRFQTEVYVALQPARYVPSANYFTDACALTTRFHPYLYKTRRYRFCDTILYSKEPRAFHGAVPCVVRTFLPFRGDRLSKLIRKHTTQRLKFP